MNKPTLLLTLLLIPTLTFAAGPRGNTRNKSFSKAKRLMLEKVYSDHKTTFYCDNPFTEDKKVIPSDKYTPKRDNKRSKRIEWVHVVPTHAFGQSFSVWRNGDQDCVNKDGKSFKGRDCARKVSMYFRYMESDMYNLVPAIGEINGNRSNYSFAMIPGEKREYGNCDMEIENQKAEPRPDIRGDIARIYKYMDWAYPGRGIISKKNKKLFDAWDKADPVDKWESKRCGRIKKAQGNENPFVSGVLSRKFLKRAEELRKQGKILRVTRVKPLTKEERKKQSLRFKNLKKNEEDK